MTILREVSRVRVGSRIVWGKSKIQVANEGFGGERVAEKRKIKKEEERERLMQNNE